MDKILIVKTSALGDIVHTYPVVAYLRKKFPFVQIDWVVEKANADLVKFHPDVNRVICSETKTWRKKIFNSETINSIKAFRKELRQEQYDVIFDLQGNIKSGLIVSQAKSPCKVGFGKKFVPEWPNLLFTNHHINPSANGNIRLNYLSLVASFFNDPIPLKNHAIKLSISSEQKMILKKLLHNGLNVLVCPGSAWRNKQVTIETLRSLLEYIEKYLGCNFLFLWGSPEEKQRVELLQTHFADRSQVVNKMSLPMLQNLMGISDLVIAMDSLPLHLAGTTKVPSFSVFGASSALKYKPSGDQHYAFQGSCPYGRSFEKRCPILRTCATGACIRDLQAEELFEAFKDWWDRGLACDL